MHNAKVLHLMGHLAEASSRINHKQEQLSDLQSKLGKIKRMASNKRVKKETVHREIDNLNSAITQMLGSGMEISKKQDMIIRNENSEILSLKELSHRMDKMYLRMIESEKRMIEVMRIVMEQLKEMSIESRETKKEEMAERKELVEIEKQIQNLESLYGRLEKEGEYNKDMLENIKERINSSKQKLAKLKA